MILKSSSFYLFLIFASVVSSFVFCVGFFPYSVVKEINNNGTVPASRTKSQVERTILMIIDAFRLDFVDSESFSYIHELVAKKEACLLRLSVNLPTVTKPRIKALTSGTIPSFLDVAMNFGDDEMKIDTFLHQMKKKNENIVFAGDETWKMFRLFTREYANKDSLFVNDFYEGDRNVTESLKLEFKRDDWKLLILHYLGLDHIGHVEGPFSRLVPSKLKEMNDIIRLIHAHLRDWNHRSQKKSILFVTGDHGMRDSGGHSGNSYQETHIPLLMIGCDCETNTDKFYKQIDFAATFSLLNDLPIPSASIGTLIPEIMFNSTHLQKLDDLRTVNERLIKMIESDGTEKFNSQFVKAKKFHDMFTNDSNNMNAFFQAETNYLISSRAISDLLAQRSMNVNIFEVLFGLSLNIFITITLLLPSDDLVKDIKLSPRSLISFILGGFILKVLVINEIFDQANDVKSFLVMMVMSVMLRVVLGIFYAKLDRFKWFRLFDHDLLYLLMLGHFLFVISVGSSSFVEEEHQIWYYFCNTIFAFLAFFEFRGPENFKSFAAVTGKCFTFLLLHIIIRRMNQTGDKWINVPDMGDWLHREEHQSLLHLQVVTSLFASTAWLIKVHSTKTLTIPFILIGNILLYFHHTRSINNRNDLPVTTLFWINLSLFAVIDIVSNMSKQAKKFNFFVIFFFISSLLHQPQNVIMPFACSVTCWFLNQACNRLIKNKTERTIAKVFLHVWTGKLFYFYQGNSNSLSTIDVNAGFVGQMHVHLPIVFIFSTINTFNGQLLSLFLLIKHLKQDSKRLLDDSGILMTLLFKWLSLLTIIPTTVFLVVITILRHHLFIWSVFSPKLLYDFFSSALMLVVMLVVKLTIKF